MKSNAITKKESEPDDHNVDVELGSASAPLIGTDTTGAKHYHVRDGVGDRIIVVDADGEVERVQDLGGRPARHWVDYVSQERGWESCSFRESAFETLARRIVDGMAEDE